MFSQRAIDIITRDFTTIAAGSSSVFQENFSQLLESHLVRQPTSAEVAFLTRPFGETGLQLDNWLRWLQQIPQRAPSEDFEQTQEPEDPTALTRPHNLDFSSLGTSCVRIARTEDRGISVKQLRRVRDFIKHFANEHGELPWMDLAPAAFNVGRLCIQKINLYQVPRFTSCSDLRCDMSGGWLDHKARDRALPVQSDRASS